MSGSALPLGSRRRHRNNNNLKMTSSPRRLHNLRSSQRRRRARHPFSSRPNPTSSTSGFRPIATSRTSSSDSPKFSVSRMLKSTWRRFWNLRAALVILRLLRRHRRLPTGRALTDRRLEDGLRPERHEVLLCRLARHPSTIRNQLVDVVLADVSGQKTRDGETDTGFSQGDDLVLPIIRPG